MEQKFRTAFNGFNRVDVVNFIEAYTTSHEQKIRKYQEEISQLRTELETIRGQSLSDDSPSEELQRLQDERAELGAELERVRAELDAAKQSSPTDLQRENAALCTENESLRTEVEQLRSSLEDTKQSHALALLKVQEENTRLRLDLAHTSGSLDEAKRALSENLRTGTSQSLSDLGSKELDAYRRAESAERSAKRRAGEIELAAKKRAADLNRAAQDRFDFLVRQSNDILESAARQVGGSVSEIHSLLDSLNQCLSQIGDTISQMDGSFTALSPSQPEYEGPQDPDDFSDADSESDAAPEHFGPGFSNGNLMAPF